MRLLVLSSSTTTVAAADMMDLEEIDLFGDKDFPPVEAAAAATSGDEEGLLAEAEASPAFLALCLVAVFPPPFAISFIALFGWNRPAANLVADEKAALIVPAVATELDAAP